MYKPCSHKLQKSLLRNDILPTLIKKFYHLSNLPLIDLIPQFLHILNQSIRIDISWVTCLLTFPSIVKELIGLKKFLLKMCLYHLDCFVCHCLNYNSWFYYLRWVSFMINNSFWKWRRNSISFISTINFRSRISISSPNWSPR